jgi:hypothetical protein
LCDVVGGVLGLWVDNELNVIHYASKTLDGAQIYCVTTVKKILDVIFAWDKFKSYIVDYKSLCILLIQLLNT